MPIGKIELNVKPPLKQVASGEYNELYEKLYKMEPDSWMGVTIRHTPDNRVKEIANVRRAVQRFFAQDDVKQEFQMASRVEQKDENTSVMYILKKIRLLPPETLEKLKPETVKINVSK